MICLIYCLETRPTFDPFGILRLSHFSLLRVFFFSFFPKVLHSLLPTIVHSLTFYPLISLFSTFELHIKDSNLLSFLLNILKFSLILVVKSFRVILSFENMLLKLLIILSSI